MNCTGDSTTGTPVVTAAPKGGSVTMAVVRAVAAVENEEPQALKPLGKVVDPEALEAIVDGESARHVTFRYCGCEVVVTESEIAVY
ncbi:hypothetical protein NDI56_15320 [Haloarcula sp. S1CR25-12]|uniref:Halobacterial output domain-containing protein n=1 Tax=Haloarcula saliterrae TaxID=2950534 RepID=A0ABU2FEU0_9EURY|nr:HalOD1 output domain-containing protein [Haloarcula sp. S1CR25-12]MDS0260777.1 hypothetical protein [Haloarcula sp. S1CR25-12]